MASACACRAFFIAARVCRCDHHIQSAGLADRVEVQRIARGVGIGGVVPLNIIEETIPLIVDKKIENYRYDKNLQMIIQKDSSE